MLRYKKKAVGPSNMDLKSIDMEILDPVPVSFPIGEILVKPGQNSI